MGGGACANSTTGSLPGASIFYPLINEQNSGKIDMDFNVLEGLV